MYLCTYVLQCIHVCMYLGRYIRTRPTDHAKKKKGGFHDYYQPTYLTIITLLRLPLMIRVTMSTTCDGGARLYIHTTPLGLVLGGALCGATPNAPPINLSAQRGDMYIRIVKADAVCVYMYVLRNMQHPHVRMYLFRDWESEAQGVVLAAIAVSYLY